MPKAPFHVKASVACPHCHQHLINDDRYVIDHIEGRAVKCPNCGTELDWWKTARSIIEENFMYNQAFAFIGAKSTIFQLTLKPGERITYSFAAMGVPVGAKVLYVNYTPQGGSLFPAELHGNVPTRRFYGTEVTLYPVPNKSVAPEEGLLTVMVSWVPSTPDDEAWLNLVDAFASHANDRYTSVVIPANVAVEAALTRLMSQYLLQVGISSKSADTFLDEAATYSHQVNVLLPLIARLNKIPLLPDDIRGALNRLRKLRNDLAHQGKLEVPLDGKSSAEVLCAALFGLHYVRYVRRELVATATS